MSQKIALINMPFASLVRPAIGISLLQAELREAGHICDQFYFNLTFLKHVKVQSYLTLSESTTRVLLGEWVFANAVFDTIHDQDYFCEVMETYQERLGSEITEEFMNSIRLQVVPFFQECMDTVDWSQYDIIGFTTSYEQNMASLGLAKQLKMKYPDCKIIFGGANCEGSMGKVLLEAFPFIDAVCIGEGDIAFPTYVSRIESSQSLKNIPGILTRDNDNHEEPVLSHSFADFVDLNSLPYPNYDDFFNQYTQIGLAEIMKPYILFESSRGCWWGEKKQCMFCGLNGSNIRYRSKEQKRIYDEIVWLQEQYGENTELYSAVDNILDYKYFQELLPALQKLDSKLNLFYEIKANLTKDQMKAMRDAGFMKVQPGIESIITDSLKKMRKGVTSLQNIRFLKWAKEFSLIPGWNILFGFPDEDPEKYQKVGHLMGKLTHLQPPFNSGPFRLARFSPYFENPERYGMINIRPLEIYRLIYPDLSEEQIYDLAYYFDFDYQDGLQPETYTLGMQEAVKEWQTLHEEAEFCYLDTGPKLQLYDSRLGQAEVHELTGWLAEIYRYCDDLRSLDNIRNHLQEKGFLLNEIEIKSALDGMVRSSWIITEDSLYLALAIPVGEYQPNQTIISRMTSAA